MRKFLSIVFYVILILLVLACIFAIATICASLGNDLTFLEQLKAWFGAGFLRSIL